jgi:hypothetical protein
MNALWFPSHVESVGATARPAPLKTSHSLPAPLKRFGSVSNTSSFLNRAGAKLVPKPKPKQVRNDVRV